MLTKNKLFSALDFCIRVGVALGKAVVVVAACIVFVHFANGLAERFGKAAAVKVIVMPVKSISCGEA